jgi:pyrrolysyl-tRNA synthetase-like protein
MAAKSFQKRTDPFAIISRIKLWPSRKGILHGLITVERQGEKMKVVTHCGQTAIVNCSKNGRLSRWIRNKWYAKPCPVCRVPEWKQEKYAKTAFLNGKSKSYERKRNLHHNPASASD